MTKFACAVLALMLAATLFAAAASAADEVEQARAAVTGCDGLVLTIDRGAAHGVALGMKGMVKAVYKEPGGEYTLNIGNFTVSQVLERSAEVTVEPGKGLNPVDASYVVFAAPLRPAPSAPEAPPPQPAPAATASWHLDEGDRAAEAGDRQAALAHYEKALELEPGNLVAREKRSRMAAAVEAAGRESKFRDYLKRADADYEKGDVKFAFLYLAEALRVFPEGEEEVSRRLAVLQGEHGRELAAILEEKEEELGDVRERIDAILAKASAAAAPAPASPVPGAPGTGASDPGKREQAAPPPAPDAAPGQPAAGQQEPFLARIRGKAEKIWRNDKGAWEALFLGNVSMVYVPAGEATIGSPAGEGDADEHPAHKVLLDGYWIGKTEVTFDQYDRFCSETGRERAGDQDWGRGSLPAIFVSWHDAAAYCAWLGEKTGLRFRLPSEAEWEKAARNRYPWGSKPPTPELANFNKDHMMTRPVGSYPLGASPYGLLDMAGNVWEWVLDWYDPGFYAASPREAPQGPESGEERVVRGGSWANGAALVRAANRSSEKPDSRLNVLGFRLALEDR